jgi:LCP family protein required for cell wall assembly
MKRRLALVTMLLALALVVASILLVQRAVTFNEAISTESAFSSKLWGALGSSDRVNVLLVGHSPEGRGGAFLADSLTILSIDPLTDETTSISIPRDLWIEGNGAMPGNGKVNEAFAIGYRDAGFPTAGDLATKVVSDVTGLRIDGWLSLDFEGFEAMVTAIGGITLQNPRTFRWALGPEQYAQGEWAGTFPAGDIALNGHDALQYARVRYTDVPAESSDFARAERQQLILAAIRKKVSLDLAGIPRGLALLDALTGRLHSNLSVVDLTLLSGHLTPDHRVRLVEDEILQATRNSVGSYVLVVIGRSSPSDYAPLQAYIADQLAAPGP